MEIDDPNVNYRQGKGIVDDFLNSGKVRTFFEEPAVSKPGWPNLVKDFDSPIFRKGGLRWDPNEIFEKKRPVTADEYFKGLELYKKYHEPIDNPDVNPFAWDRHQLTDLLTTREELMPSDAKGVPLSRKSSIENPFSDWYQIPKTEDQLNPGNTTAWRYEPDYGFRRVNPDAAWEDGFLKYRTYTPTSEELSVAKSYLKNPTEAPEASIAFPDFQGGLNDTKPFLRYWDSLSPAVQKQMFEYIKNIYSNKHP